MSTPEDAMLPAVRRGTVPIPRTLDEQLSFAAVVVKSGLAPASFKTAEAVVIAIQSGGELGMLPLQSLRAFTVINGRATLNADGVAAVVMGSGKAEYFLPEEVTADRATYVTKRKGAPKEVRYTFTMAQAVQAKLPDRNPTYKAYPERMLSARAKSFLGRDVYPDVVGGMLSAEELMDLPEETVERPAIELPRRLGEAPKPAEVPAAPVPVPHTRGGTCLACHPQGGGTCRLEPPSTEPDPSLPPDPAETELAALAAEPELPLGGNGPGKLPSPETMLSETERKDLLRLCNRHGRGYPELRKWLEGHGVPSSLAIPARLKTAVTAWVERREAAAELAATTAREPGGDDA